MDPDFDPYDTWLGIPPEEQPADYYRLLGLLRFESDRQRISKASNQRLTHLGSFKNGEHGRAAQKLAGELSKATSCLLNPYRKQLYDSHLQSGGEPALEERPSPAPASPAPASPTPPARENLTPPTRKPAMPQSAETMTSLLADRRKKGRSGSRKTVWAIVLVAAAVLVVGAGVITTQRLGQTPGVPLAVVPDHDPPAPADPSENDEAGQPNRPQMTEASESPAPKPPEITEAPESPAPKPPAVPEEMPLEKPAPIASLEVPATEVAESTSIPAPLDGSGGNALRFDGNGYVTLDGTQGLVDFRKPFTVELWVRFRPEAESHFLVGDAVFGNVHPEVPDGTTVGWQLWVMNGEEGQRRIAIAAPQGFGTLVTVRENAWQHIAVCSDAKQIAIFVDGRLAGRREAGPLQASFTPSPLPLHIASHAYLHPSQPRGLQGDVRAVRISSTCRYTQNFVPVSTLAADEHAEAVFDFVADKSVAEVADGTGQDRHGILHAAEWIEVEDDPPVAAMPVETVRPGTVPGPSTPAPVAPAVAEKRPVPDEAARKVARQRLEEILRDELAAAKQPKDHLALADKLVKLASESSDDVAAEYTLWDEARQQAILGLGWSKALATAQQMAERFEQDRWVLQADTIQRSADVARSNAERKKLAETSLDAVAQLLRAGRFELAGEVAKTAVGVASRSLDADLGKAARQMRDQVTAVKRRWNEARQAQEQLTAAPDDADLNLVVGRFLCFQQGDWERGLRHLLKGSHEELCEVAQQDLSSPREAGSRIALADAWYDSVASVERGERAAVLGRYLHWARQALPGLQGLSKVDVEKRIAEVEGDLPSYLRRDAERVSRTPPAPVPHFQPPTDFVGLLGRMQIGGVDPGVLWKYECGAAIAKPTLADVLRRVGANAAPLRIELVGRLHVSADTTVNIVHRGGTPNGGQSVLAVDGQVLGQVGGERATSDVYKLELTSGEHAVRWVLSGTELGTCALQFADSETGQPLIVYHNPIMRNALREQPFRTRLDVNIIKNR